MMKRQIRIFALSKDAVDNLAWVARDVGLTPAELLEQLACRVQPGRVGRIALSAPDDEES